MLRVTNCIIIEDKKVLLIKKPSRGWYAIPGGKMEQGEMIKESVIREIWEETGLTIHSPKLAGVFTFTIHSETGDPADWMMFTFRSHSYDGSLTEICEEGELHWVPLEDIPGLPMAAGDKQIFEHMKSSDEMIYGAFSYTKDYQLLKSRFDPLIS